MSGSRASQRELVFCHQCQNEWYRDGSNGLQCPMCESDFTEVIDPDFDPRVDVADSSALDSHNPWADDPDEDDIDDFNSDTGQTFNAGFSESNNSQGRSLPLAQPQDAFGQTLGVFPPLLGSFANMLQGMTGPRENPFGFPASGVAPQQVSGPRIQGISGSLPRQSMPRVNVWTASGPGFSVTTHTTSRTFSSGGPRPGGDDVNPQDFNMILEGIVRNMGFPSGPPGSPRGSGPANSLANLFNTLLNPANAAHGDAVFSQEAFDRVMSQLMEEHVSGNAPGPASEAAINALPKMRVTEAMLDEATKTAECSICMEDVTVGEEVATLPCSHWFHYPCVEAWLKEHDTCPVCRAGITPKNGDRNTVRSPAQPPLHDEDPFLLARQESGTREHPYVVPESPTRERRRPNPRRHSSGETTTTPSSRHTNSRADDNGGIAGRMRSFFGGGGGNNGRR